MSARRAAVAVKPAASRDVRSILAYTGKQWGSEQRDRYEAEITKAFETLSANPQIGVACDQISPGLRSYTVRQHVVYYRVGPTAVTIVRILHGKMDAARHIQE